MQILKRFFGCVSMLICVNACTNYEPVAASECAHVVTHAQKVLGKLSPSYKDLMMSCKAATDTKRGCILAAEKMGQMTKCD